MPSLPAPPSDDAFLALRNAGALPVAFAQFVAMPQLRLLGEGAGARGQSVTQVQWGQDFDL